jgi:hypothetical protein
MALSVYCPDREDARTKSPVTLDVPGFVRAQRSSPFPEVFPYYNSIASDMSQNSTFTSSSSNYQSVFDSALEAYKRKTNKDIRSHPLFTKLETCDSPDAVLTLLREQIPSFGQSHSTDNILSKWLSPTVNVLYALSGAVGGGIGLVRLGQFFQNPKFISVQVYPPAGVIFTGIGVLLSVSSFDSFAPRVIGDVCLRRHRAVPPAKTHLLAYSSA